MQITNSLISKCIQQDRRAHKELYEASAGYVYAIIKNYIKDQDFVKDLMQETFAKVFNSLGQYDSNKGKFKSWLSQITVYTCLDHLKKSKRIDFNYGIENLDIKSESVFDYLDKLTKKDIESMLSTMPSGYRTIFLLSVVEGYNHKEIAGMLDISLSTSRTQLMRATAWIRKNLVNSQKFLQYEISR